MEWAAEAEAVHAEAEVRRVVRRKLVDGRLVREELYGMSACCKQAWLDDGCQET